MFKLDSKKDEIHFWDDVDYIIENMVEKFGNLNHPKAKQLADISYLTLSKV